MKTSYAATIVLALSTLAAGQAMAAPDFASGDEIRANIASSTLSRDQVRAAATEAVRTKALPVGEFASIVEQPKADVKSAEKTREQVRAEMFAARREAANSKQFVFPVI